MEIKVIPIDPAVATGASQHSQSSNEKTENDALAQIMAMDYARKYIGKYDKVFELGMIFAQDKRNLVAFDGSERTE